MAPAFFFEVTEIQKHPRVPPRYSSGVWLPPKALGYNIQRPGSQRHLLCFNQVNVVVLPSVPPGVEFFKTFSIYYDDQKFWAVGYDVLTHSVNDGLENSDSSSEGSDSDEDSLIWDWSALNFAGMPEDHTWTSYVTIAGQSQQLLLQRTDQLWARKLFPERYYSPNMYPPEHYQYGGLVGELPLILALVAFSAHPDNLIAAFQQCLTGQSWGIHNFTRGRGWSNGRGIMIRVWVWPNPPEHLRQLASTKEDLRAFESGECGKIYS